MAFVQNNGGLSLASGTTPDSRLSEHLLPGEGPEVRNEDTSPRFNRLRQSSIPSKLTNKKFLLVSDIPSHVSSADIASHFPNTSSHFPLAGQSKVPIAVEQSHRFDGLAARREALAAREAKRLDAAAERHKALLLKRQTISHMKQQPAKSLLSSSVVSPRPKFDHQENEKDQSKTISNTSLTGQLKSWFSNIFGGSSSNNARSVAASKKSSANSSNLTSNEFFPFSYELTMAKPSNVAAANQEARRRKRLEDKRSSLLIYTSHEPEYVNISALERRFPHSASKLKQFGEVESYSSDLLVPFRDKDNIRMVHLYAHRDRIVERDRLRQITSEKRAKDIITMRQQTAKATGRLRRFKVLCLRLSEHMQLKKLQLIMAARHFQAEQKNRQFLLDRTLTLKRKFNEVIWMEVESKKLCAIEDERIKQQKKMSVAKNRRKQVLSERVNLLKANNMRRVAKAKAARKNIQIQNNKNMEREAKPNTISDKVVSTTTLALTSLGSLASKTIDSISNLTPRKSTAPDIVPRENRTESSLQSIELESDDRRNIVLKSEVAVREGIYEAFKTGKMDIQKREAQAFATREKMFEEKAKARRVAEAKHVEVQQSYTSQLRVVEADEAKQRSTSISADEAREFKKLVNNEQFEKKLVLERIEQQKIEIEALQAKLQSINKEIEDTTQQLKEKVGSRPLMVPITTGHTDNEMGDNAITDFSPTAQPDDMRPSSSLRVATTVGGFEAAQPPSQDVILLPPPPQEAPKLLLPPPPQGTKDESAQANLPANAAAPVVELTQKSSAVSATEIHPLLEHPEAKKDDVKTDHKSKPKEKKAKSRKFCC